MAAGLVRVRPLSEPPTPELNLDALARWLGMSPHPLDNHLRSIYQVLDVNNFNAALLMVVRAGLVAPRVDDAPRDRGVHGRLIGVRPIRRLFIATPCVTMNSHPHPFCIGHDPESHPLAIATLRLLTSDFRPPD